MNHLDGEALERLHGTLGNVLGSDLAAHLRRDAVLLVSPQLDLLTVATGIAADDAQSVKRWLEMGQVRRPTDDERANWLASPERPWRSVVVQPFVCIQSLD